MNATERRKYCGDKCRKADAYRRKLDGTTLISGEQLSLFTVRNGKGVVELEH